MSKGPSRRSLLLGLLAGLFGWRVARARPAPPAPAPVPAPPAPLGPRLYSYDLGPVGHVTTCTYDACNRLTSVQDDPGRAIVTLTYDGQGFGG